MKLRASFRRGFLHAWLLLVAGTSVVGAATPGTIRFADVRRSDKLEIAYGAWGCWDAEAADFSYSARGYGEFAVTEYVRATKPRRGSEPVPRGRVLLERGEIAKLDRLLDSYRRPPPPDYLELIGPMVPSLHLRLWRNGRLVAEERLTQRFYPGEDVLTFGEMLRALREHARR